MQNLFCTDTCCKMLLTNTVENVSLNMQRIVTLTFIFLLSLDNSDNIVLSTLQLISSSSRSSSSSLVSGLVQDVSSFSLKSNNIYPEGSVSNIKFSFAGEHGILFGRIYDTFDLFTYRTIIVRSMRTV